MRSLFLTASTVLSLLTFSQSSSANVVPINCEGALVYFDYYNRTALVQGLPYAKAITLRCKNFSDGKTTFMCEGNALNLQSMKVDIFFTNDKSKVKLIVRETSKYTGKALVDIHECGS